MGEKTFGDLGLDFPLFEAPVSSTSDYAGVAACCLCGAKEAHCFRFGIGSRIELACPRCQAENVCRGDEIGEEPCGSCGADLDEALGDDELLSCYDCLRAGRATFTQDTEFGMVSREEALSGRTHGVPGLATTMFETVATGDLEGGEQWVAALVPREHLAELIRTPRYSTWQGESWLFCCRSPMIYCGEWRASDFERQAPDGDAVALAKSMVAADESRYWNDVFPDRLSFYVFRCAACGQRRAHTDSD